MPPEQGPGDGAQLRAGRAFSCRLPVLWGPTGALSSACVVLTPTAFSAAENVLRVCQRKLGPLLRCRHGGLPQPGPLCFSECGARVRQPQAHQVGPCMPQAHSRCFPEATSSCSHLPWRSLWPLLAPPPRPATQLSGGSCLSSPASKVELWLASAPLRPIPVPGPAWVQVDWDDCRAAVRGEGPGRNWSNRSSGPGAPPTQSRVEER